MITDHYSKTVKRRAQETTTEQDTPQDKERMQITPTERGILRREMVRRATAVQMKAALKAQEWDDQEEPIEDYEYDVAICRSLLPPVQVPTPLYIAGRVHSRAEGFTN
jgi:hypothetical protein